MVFVVFRGFLCGVYGFCFSCVFFLPFSRFFTAFVVVRCFFVVYSCFSLGFFFWVLVVHGFLFFTVFHVCHAFHVFCVDINVISYF